MKYNIRKVFMIDRKTQNMIDDLQKSEQEESGTEVSEAYVIRKCIKKNYNHLKELPKK